MLSRDHLTDCLAIRNNVRYTNKYKKIIRSRERTDNLIYLLIKYFIRYTTHNLISKGD